jgi:hypothetical protein
VAFLGSASYRQYGSIEQKKAQNLGALRYLDLEEEREFRIFMAEGREQSSNPSLKNRWRVLIKYTTIIIQDFSG